MPSVRIVNSPPPPPTCDVAVRRLPRDGFHYLQPHVTIACECGFAYQGWGTDSIAGFHLRNLCPLQANNTLTTYTLRLA